MAHSRDRGQRIAVLLAVYDGESFLQDQIDTIAAQSVDRIDLWASDDGSQDGSVPILRAAVKGWKRGTFRILEGPRKGFAENFRSLLLHNEIDADYFAFCDQDDLWDSDKLEAAVGWLSCQNPARPALFCSRTRTVDIDGRPKGFSPLFPRPPSFRNALVQSLAGGNTMVMNRAARDAVRETSRGTSFISHDWWCYLVVAGIGGVVHYSPEPKTSYRQHDANLIGENSSWRARMSRFRFMLKGRFAEWNESNLASLATCEAMLTPDAAHAMRLFAQGRSRVLPFRLTALLRSGVYRQTVFGQLGLYAACLLRKL